MLTFTRTRLSPLGLHLGRYTATVVQLAGTAERPELRATAQGRLPPVESGSPEEADRIVANALRRLIADHRLRGRKVVSCLSADELFVETVRLPQLPPEEIAKVVPWEAAERLPYPLAEAELRHLMAGEVRQDNVVKQEVILLASHRDVIQRRLRVLELAGLTPIGIDVEPCAWLRCLFQAGRLAETSRMAYLFCGETTSTVMFAEGQRALFLKSFPIGGRSFDEAVAQSLAVDIETAASMRTNVFAASSLDGDNEVHRSIIESLRPTFDSLVAELELCLRYYKVTFRGRPLDGLVLSGSEAAPWLAEYLGERVGVSTRTINPFDCLSRSPTSPSLNQRSGRWATALGLALKRMT
ncbi:MAG: pilus assembly protein PilM [Candidatus Saccharimonas sp.]|nr:pilus assembly protein PilM [Planctomycetaceae bacterium]